MHDAWFIQLKSRKAKRGHLTSLKLLHETNNNHSSVLSRCFGDLSFGSSGGWKLTIISFCSFCGYLWRRRRCNRVQVRKHIIDRRKRFDPFHLSQYMLVFDDVFIGGQQDVELPAAELRHKPTTQSRSALTCGDKGESTFCRKKQKIWTSVMRKRKKEMQKKGSVSPCKQF